MTAKWTHTADLRSKQRQLVDRERMWPGHFLARLPKAVNADHDGARAYRDNLTEVAPSGLKASANGSALRLGGRSKSFTSGDHEYFVALEDDPDRGADLRIE